MAKRKSKACAVTPPDEIEYRAEQLVRDTFMKSHLAKEQVRQVQKEMRASEAKVEKNLRKKTE